jgi:hypothetical protein
MMPDRYPMPLSLATEGRHPQGRSRASADLAAMAVALSACDPVAVLELLDVPGDAAEHGSDGQAPSLKKGTAYRSA